MNCYLKKAAMFALSLILIVTTLSGCATGKKAQKTTIEVFVFKPEVVATFQKVITQFEKKNPTIHVSLSTPVNAYSVLKARMVKGNEPDIVGLDGEQYYVDYAKAGIFEDVTHDPLMKKVNHTYIKMLADLEQDSGKVHGFPYAANATGILYNKDEFKKLNLKIPKTWPQLIELCKKIKKLGKTPFYMGYKDDWTIYSAWNPLAGNFTGSDFYTNVTNRTATFEGAYNEPLKRFVELNKYSQGDIFSYNYNNATVAFAKGQSLMYLQSRGSRLC
jgi:raffinose/stachyose/melibiose transport system substrate-binding protein